MRLKSIKLSGFKSFVDSTTVLLPSNLTAIVGPNGCGKSNIIDAVRWVMGESSAKQLRGESLDDVIFNGSTGRKPVSHAAIELNFDNSEGRMQGAYASYSEITVRREITRDGQSNYYLNNTRCRRRDITDLFLGTGLGPRSYAIIEQGMISRLIEAKPEDLRNYVEEAAGISKYKERRRETELRIGHTQENLARLSDIRDELGKQLDHLQRQSTAAEKYKVFKEEERLLRVQIHVLRWRAIHADFSVQQSGIHELEAKLAHLIEQQQQLVDELEQQQQLQKEKTLICNEVQENYYQQVNEAALIEQNINNQQERCAQWNQEQAEIARNCQRINEQITSIEQTRENLVKEIAMLEPQCEETKAVTEQSQYALQQSEEVVREWQLKWDAYIQQTAQLTQSLQVEQTRIQHLEQRMQSYQQRIARLEGEQQQRELELSGVNMDEFSELLSVVQNQHATAEESLIVAMDAISEHREQTQTLTHELDVIKNQLQQMQGRKTSLETLQQIALGQREEAAMQWLDKNGLAELPRLAQMMQVEPGWEKAAETVLERYLQAVCMDELNPAQIDLHQIPQANLSLVVKTNTAHSNATQSYPTLLSKVKANFSLNNLLAGIYIADDLTSALAIAEKLSDTESVVTRDGIWLGKAWLAVSHKAEAVDGILERERELTTLKQQIEVLEDEVANKREMLAQVQQQLQEFERQRESITRDVARLVGQQADVSAKHKVQQAHVSQVAQRAQQIAAELADCVSHVTADETALVAAQTAQQEAQMILAESEEQREVLQEERTTYQAALESTRKQAQHDSAIAHQVELRLQAASLQLESQQQNHVQLQQQLQELETRQAQLLQSLANAQEPVVGLTEKLEILSSSKNELEATLRQAKSELQTIEAKVHEQTKQRQSLEQQSLNVRDQLEEVRLAGQASEVRSKGLEEQVAEMNFDLQTVLNELPTDANDKVWDENLAQVVRRIERLGPINLAAIDEYTEQAERKNYLDVQHADLIEALTILEEAMAQIDQETKARFKETYDNINTNFQTLFPSLFGGGNASLSLNDSDLLTTGITVMAQPPGKRNSTIHLLSGGEKALTAISLVFAMFKLNPAPFCILDEVDAPLDDANVGRFCNLVKEMAKEVQFIFISHNKIAIEMAEQLAGVTMKEAGVSRMVAVDIEEAIKMAEA